MKCPKCKNDLALRIPVRTKRAGIPVLRLRCNECKENYLATDAPYSHPYQTNPKQSVELIKRVRSVRLSDRDMEAIEAGRLRLVVINRRITIAV